VEFRLDEGRPDGNVERERNGTDTLRGDRLVRYAGARSTSWTHAECRRCQQYGNDDRDENQPGSFHDHSSMLSGNRKI